MRSLPFLTLLLLAAPACKHDDGEAVGTATIRSGTPEGPRVTDVRTAPADRVTPPPGFDSCIDAVRAEGCVLPSAFSAELPACRIAKICPPSR